MNERYYQHFANTGSSGLEVPDKPSYVAGLSNFFQTCRDQQKLILNMNSIS